MAATLIYGAYLVQKKRTKSIVWKNFGLRASKEGVIVDKEQDKPVCRSCGQSVPAKGGNTSNLYQHLRDHHPTIYAELAPKTSKQSTIRTTKFASIRLKNCTEPMISDCLQEGISQIRYHSYIHMWCLHWERLSCFSATTDLWTSD